MTLILYRFERLFSRYRGKFGTKKENLIPTIQM
jgi:hypothetical protein